MEKHVFQEMLQILQIVLGWEWLEIGYEKIIETKSLDEDVSHNVEYLYEDTQHPVQRWYGLNKRTALESMQIIANRETLSLLTLATNLKAITGCSNSQKLISRLKNPTEFYPVEFEIEVAASYRNKNYLVEFIDPSVDGKSPDLKVTSTNGTTFYVECKWHNPKNDEAKKTENIWFQLEKRIIDYLLNKRKCFAVQLDALNGMVSNDINQLFDFIIEKIDHLDKMNQIPITAYVFDFTLSSREYQIYLFRIATYDQPIVSNVLNIPWLKDPSKVKILSELYVKEDGITMYRNPIAISFVDWLAMDLVSRICKQFKKAVKQLKDYQPGVIWIRIPDNSIIQKEFMESSEKIESALTQEMARDKNRRVTAVIILTKFYESVEIDGNSGMKQVPVRLIVEHSNPRFKIE